MRQLRGTFAGTDSETLANKALTMNAAGLRLLWVLYFALRETIHWKAGDV